MIGTQDSNKFRVEVAERERGWEWVCQGAEEALEREESPSRVVETNDREHPEQRQQCLDRRRRCEDTFKSSLRIVVEHFHIWQQKTTTNEHASN